MLFDMHHDADECRAHVDSFITLQKKIAFLLGTIALASFVLALLVSRASTIFSNASYDEIGDDGKNRAMHNIDHTTI